ncbi:MAG TPA: sugar-binding protein [Spirochaetia bacterium]|nr:sugar-binding protein [Spirochaetia bacterium]
MRRTCVFAVAALFMLSGSLFAGGKSEGGLDIGLAMPESHVARWVMDGQKLKENAEALGYKAEYTLADADQAKQNKQIEDYITKGVKLLVIANINTGVNTVLADATKAGIEIISYDRLMMDSADYNYYTTFNLKKVGFLQATAIVQALKLEQASAAKPKVITLFAGSPTDNNAYFFYDGAMEVLNPYVDKGVLKIVGPYPRTSADKDNFQRIATEGWRAENAKKRMENLLTGDAKDVVLDAILAPNDPVGRACIEACMNDAKYDTIAKLPIVTGQDGELATVQYILQGKQYMTVFKDSRLLAEATIKLADAILKKQTPNIPGTEKTTFSTNKKDVTTYLLDPILVTKDNVKQIIIDSGYYSKDDLKTIGI